MALKEDQWKEKKASVRVGPVVSGMRLMIVHQKRHGKPRGGSASRKRSVRGRSQTGRILLVFRTRCFDRVQQLQQDILLVRLRSENSITECLVEF